MARACRPPWPSRAGSGQLVPCGCGGNVWVIVASDGDRGKDGGAGGNDEQQTGTPAEMVWLQTQRTQHLGNGNLEYRCVARRHTGGSPIPPYYIQAFGISACAEFPIPDRWDWSADVDVSVNITGADTLVSPPGGRDSRSGDRRGRKDIDAGQHQEPDSLYYCPGNRLGSAAGSELDYSDAIAAPTAHLAHSKFGGGTG